MKYFSKFSGIGGFELGILNATQATWLQRWRDNQGLPYSERSQLPSKSLCVGYSEINKYAIQIYEKNFKGHKNYGDCKKIKWEEVEDFDLLVGGFPCQSFSIAGKRMGFEDIRGTLFFEIARCLREKQPRFFLLENVKGLLSHDKGNTFLTIITTLDELGYDLQWQVLNSKNFGVPQNRERVFIVGHLRGTSRPEIFPIGESSQISIKKFNTPKHSNNRVYAKEGIGPALNTGQGGNRQPKIAPTMRANHHNTADVHFILKDSKIRRLTPTECERLQGFPDGWTEGISDTQRYKCLGNAVSTPVITAIMEKLLQPKEGGE